MNQIATFSIVLLLIMLTSITSGQANYTQQKNVVVVDAHGIGVTMDLFTPTGDKNGLGIVDVVSGAWSSDRGKLRDHKLAQIYDIFCKRGYTVFAIRPGSVSRFSAHDMIEHLETAIDQIKKDAEQYGIDPERMGITGASAGGHLASLVAVRQKTKLAAAGVFFPPTDFLDFGSKRIDPASDDRLGRFARALTYREESKTLSPEEIDKELTAISPARQVTASAPPFLLIHGDADDVVPLQQSEVMVAALKAEGVSAELIVKKGGGHPWFTIPVEVAKMADWFDDQLDAGSK